MKHTLGLALHIARGVQRLFESLHQGIEVCRIPVIYLLTESSRAFAVKDQKFSDAQRIAKCLLVSADRSLGSRYRRLLPAEDIRPKPSVDDLLIRLQRVLAGGPRFSSWSCLSRFELGVPRPCDFYKGGYDAADTMRLAMPSGLHRTYGAHHLHFITCSCYRRLPFLDFARARDRFLSVLEHTRQRYRLVVVGYVVMPEHVHLLLTEPEVGSPSTVMQVLKQRTAHALLPRRKRRDPRQRELFGKDSGRAFWQARFHDFNVDHEEANREAALHASQSGEAPVWWS